MASLALMLALVVAAMASLERPETIDKLGRVFGLQRTAPGNRHPAGDDGATATAVRIVAEPLTPLDADWDAVEDNAPFRDEETPAWFRLFAAVRDQSPQQLEAQSMGDATYAQLRAQPELYRARVVTLRGTIQQAVKKSAPANDAGVQHYYQLGIAPAGGGEWPLLVYALQLPDDFPLGDDLHEPATIHAAFYKTWAYSYDERTAVGLAPVCLASTFDWSPHTPADESASEAASPGGAFWPLVIVAAGAAVALSAWVARRTRRPPRAATPAQLPGVATMDATDVHEQLARLRDQDGAS